MIQINMFKCIIIFCYKTFELKYETVKNKVEA